MIMLRLYRGVNLVGTILAEERPATVELPAGMRSLPPTVRALSDVPPATVVDVYRFVRSFSAGDVYTAQERAVDRSGPPLSKSSKRPAR